MQIDGTVPSLPALSPAQYLAQHPLFDQPGFDALRDDFGLPCFCPPSGVARVNVWCGSSGTVTPLHFDSYEGILAQARWNGEWAARGASSLTCAAAGWAPPFRSKFCDE